MLTHKGIIFDQAIIDQKLSAKERAHLKNKLTIMTSQQAGRKVIYHKNFLYKNIQVSTGNKTKNLFIAARFGQIPYKLDYKIRIPDGETIPFEKFEGTFKLHENQTVAMNYLIENVYSPAKVGQGKAGCTFVMETGLGKSYMAVGFFLVMKVKCLVILPDTSLLDQWLEIFTNTLPHIKVGQYHAKQKIDGDIVFMTINSALSPAFTFGRGKSKTVPISAFEYYKRFGMVIYDEIPNYATGKRQEIFWRANFKYVMGITATPDERIDKMDLLFQMHTGPLVYAKDIDGFDIEKIIWKGKIEAIRYKGPPEHTEQIKNAITDMTSTTEMITQFSNDPYRNKLVVMKALELFNDNKNVFIFTEQRFHVTLLQKLLEKTGIIPICPELVKEIKTPDKTIKDPTNPEGPKIKSDRTLKISKLMGGTANDEREMAVQKANIIIITYKYGAEGTSIPKMTSMVFASPRRNKMRQIIGRILRRGGDPSILRHVVDIIDEETSMKDQFKTRREVYQEKGFNITETEIKYTELENM